MKDLIFCTYMVCGTGNLYLCELERCKVQQRCEKGNHTDERTALRTEHTAQKAERSSEYGYLECLQ